MEELSGNLGMLAHLYGEQKKHKEKSPKKAKSEALKKKKHKSASSLLKLHSAHKGEKKEDMFGADEFDG